MQRSLATVLVESRDNEFVKLGYDGVMETTVDWSLCPAVERNPMRLAGAWAFRGTRVPVSALFTNLAGGATVDEFTEWFPGVTKEQVNLVLEHAAQGLSAPLAA